MQAKSKKQQRFMGAELARKRVGKSTKTKMSEGQLKDFAKTKQKGLPENAIADALSGKTDKSPGKHGRRKMKRMKPKKAAMNGKGIKD